MNSSRGGSGSSKRQVHGNFHNDKQKKEPGGGGGLGGLTCAYRFTMLRAHQPTSCLTCDYTIQLDFQPTKTKVI